MIQATELQTNARRLVLVGTAGVVAQVLTPGPPVTRIGGSVYPRGQYVDVWLEPLRFVEYDRVTEYLIEQGVAGATRVQRTVMTGAGFALSGGGEFRDMTEAPGWQPVWWLSNAAPMKWTTRYRGWAGQGTFEPTPGPGLVYREASFSTGVIP